ncbi:MAG TPA: LemA family protein [bacterium]|nr:LemA family protein [bacterium]
MTALWIVLGVVAALVLWAIGVYNGLIKLKVRTEEAASDIDVQLKRRHDLIPNLVNTVKGYASHEEKTFTAVIEARNKAMAAQTMGEKAEAENMLSNTLKSIFALAEAYPDLKANQNFLHLQSELVDTEDKIQASRRFYNANARDFNTKMQVFPNNILANMFGYKKFDFYEAVEAERQNVNVQF